MPAVLVLADRQPGLGPALEAAVEDGHVAVAHRLEGQGGERGARAGGADDDDPAAGVQGLLVAGAGRVGEELQQPPGRRHRPVDVAVLPLFGLAHVDEHGTSVQLVRRLLRRHHAHLGPGLADHLHRGLGHFTHLFLFSRSCSHGRQRAAGPGQRRRPAAPGACGPSHPLSLRRGTAGCRCGGYPRRTRLSSSSEASGSLTVVICFHSSASSSSAAFSRNCGAAHSCTSKSRLM